MNRKHRQHADFHGEEPETEIHYGVDGIKVSLDAFGPHPNTYAFLLNQIQSTWGDKPSRKLFDYELTDEVPLKQLRKLRRYPEYESGASKVSHRSLYVFFE